MAAAAHSIMKSLGEFAPRGGRDISFLLLLLGLPKSGYKAVCYRQLVHRSKVTPKGWSYLLGQRLRAYFVMKFAFQKGEGEKTEEMPISKTNHKAPLTMKMPLPL